MSWIKGRPPQRRGGLVLRSVLFGLYIQYFATRRSLNNKNGSLISSLVQTFFSVVSFTVTRYLCSCLGRLPGRSAAALAQGCEAVHCPDLAVRVDLRAPTTGFALLYASDL